MLLNRKIYFVSLVILAWSLCLSCSKDRDYNADYYIGLQKLREGKEDEARTKFNNCIKKGSYYCGRESLKSLTTFGNVQDKNKAATELLKKYSDSGSKLIAVKQLYSAGEVSLILENTENLDFETENNELIKLRLECLKTRNREKYNSEVYKWFTCRALTENHYKFYRDIYSLDINEEQITPFDFVIDYRIDLYRRNYLGAYEKAFELFDYFDSGVIEAVPQLVSDIGKSFLYGNDNFAANAQLFVNKAETVKGSAAEFYFWFYAGRFYDRAALYFKQAINCFENAMECAKTGELRDNALWYLLNTSLSSSADTTINKLEAYANTWNSPEYFDDFFDKLVPALIEKGRWNAFGQLLNIIDGKASNEVTAKIAYLYGRLLQEGYAYSQNRDFEIKRAFERSLRSGTDEYYRILSAYQLGLKGNKLWEALSVWSNLDKQSFTVDEDAEAFLRGFATYGFPEKIYPMWLELRDKGITTETSMYLADFLHKCGSSKNEYNVQSLRIASKAGLVSERPLTKEELKLIYPENFKNHVDTYSEKYDIKSSVIFALIRSESFFDAEVTSTAGAVGLTQLMEFTAGDISRKLKKPNYSLTDPEVNIEFGTYYLSELVRRCNDSYLQGLLSYNAGITRVRRWLSSSMLEFGRKQDMSSDLFLETVAYTETRNYGKKLLPATVMYQWLYSDEPAFYETVESFIK